VHFQSTGSEDDSPNAERFPINRLHRDIGEDLGKVGVVVVPRHTVRQAMLHGRAAIVEGGPLGTQTTVQIHYGTASRQVYIQSRLTRIAIVTSRTRVRLAQCRLVKVGLAGFYDSKSHAHTQHKIIDQKLRKKPRAIVSFSGRTTGDELVGETDVEFRIVGF